MSVSQTITITITCDDCGAFATRPDAASATATRRALAREGWTTRPDAGRICDMCPRCVIRRMDTTRSTAAAVREARAASAAATRRGRSQ